MSEKWAKNNPEKRREVNRNWAKRNYTKKHVYDNQWRRDKKKEDPMHFFKRYDKSKKLLIRYGLTDADVQAMWIAQNSMCPICEKELNDDKSTCIDHDHKTGRVRGLVHTYCNLIIGVVENNMELLPNVITHLGDN